MGSDINSRAKSHWEEIEEPPPGAGLNLYSSEDQSARDTPDLISRMSIPFILVELNRFTVTAVSDAALGGLARRAEEVVGRPVYDVLVDEDQSGARKTLETMAAGTIDFYRAHRHVKMPNGDASRVLFCVRAFDFDGRRVALVTISLGGDPLWSHMTEQLGVDPVVMALGKADASWVVTAVSQEVAPLLGLTAKEVVGQALFGKAELHRLRALLEGGEHHQPDSALALRVTLRDNSGAKHSAICVTTCLQVRDTRYFILLPDAGPAHSDAINRASQLESHLWRIASEVEASGVLIRMGNMPPPSVPPLGVLTDRQLEVLAHLLRGERVPTIAKGMHVSQSTVRNHLSALFAHFGVHSQSELLHLLSGGDVLST